MMEAPEIDVGQINANKLLASEMYHKCSFVEILYNPSIHTLPVSALLIV